MTALEHSPLNRADAGEARDQSGSTPRTDACETLQIMNGWVVELSPEYEKHAPFGADPAEFLVPLFDLRTLPGWTQLAEDIARARTEPVWRYTPEGHDDEYEYVVTADCDGQYPRTWRSTPERCLVIPRGCQESIPNLPPKSTRRLVGAAPGEEPRS